MKNTNLLLALGACLAALNSSLTFAHHVHGKLRHSIDTLCKDKQTKGSLKDLSPELRALHARLAKGDSTCDEATLKKVLKELQTHGLMKRNRVMQDSVAPSLVSGTK